MWKEAALLLLNHFCHVKVEEVGVEHCLDNARDEGDDVEEILCKMCRLQRESPTN
jgi:hypothetical protein